MAAFIAAIGRDLFRIWRRCARQSKQRRPRDFAQSAASMPMHAARLTCEQLQIAFLFLTG
jgi:hypothetical protein